MNKVIDAYYRENYDSLVKRLSYRLGTRENAEDTVQEAFTRAVKYYESCSVDFDRWFKVLLANAVKDAQGDIRTAGLTKSIDDATDELEPIIPNRSEEHTSELQSLMRISYAVFCLQKKNKIYNSI